MADPVQMSLASPRRRRDRRGRGLRGPLLPADAPGHRSRAERFDDLLLDVVAELERHFPEQLAHVEFGVEDAPTATGAEVDRRIVFGRYLPAGPDGPGRIVLYRRPLEIRAQDDTELAAMVRTVTVDCVADLLGVDPGDIDPSLRPD